MRTATPLLAPILALTFLAAGPAHAQVQIVCTIDTSRLFPENLGSAIKLMFSQQSTQRIKVILSAPGAGSGIGRIQAHTFDPALGCPDGLSLPQDIMLPPPTFRFGAYTAAASNPTGSYLAVGAPLSHVGGASLAGAAYIYRINDIPPPIIEEAALQQFGGTQPLEGVGNGVAFDSETDMRFLAVGAAGPEERGVVDIFRFNAAGEFFSPVTRLESGLPPGSAPTTNFGSVALIRDPDTDFMAAFLGAFDAFHGYTVVAFTSPDGGTTWGEPNTIIVGDPNSQCTAGPKVTAAPVSLGFAIIAVGCPETHIQIQGFVVNEHTTTFDLSVFGFVPSDIRVAPPKRPPPHAGESARAATTLFLAAGDPVWNEQTGQVLLYRVTVEPDGSDASAEEIAVITASDGEPFDRFGQSVSLSEDARWLLVGAPGKDFNAGAAYLYDLEDLVVASEPVPAPGGVALSAAPNPFRDRTQLTLTLDRPASVRVAVYDALGREAALLHDGPLPPGRHPLALDGRGLPSGVYLVRVAGDALLTRRVTLLR